MRLVSVQKLDSRMILAKPIYYRDILILKEGCSELHRFSEKLSNLGIDFIYINDAISNDIEVPDAVSFSTRQACKIALQKTIKNHISSDHLDITMLSSSITQLLEEILNNNDIMISLKNIGSTDESTFVHSITTTIYSLILASKLGFSKNMLHTLAMGTLLHDIGKILLDSSVVFKNDKLTNEEFEYVKTHTTLGYKQLKKCSTLSELSRIIALSHHEKLNGSGYPNHASSIALHPFIRIVTIADVYDALTSDRCYRKHWTAKQAFDHLLENSGTLYDTEFVREFIQLISIYPNGSLVRLSNNYLGIVKEQNKNMAERPVVRVIADPYGNIINAFELNLMNELSITIIESELDIAININ